MSARNSQIGMLAVTAATVVGCISIPPPPPAPGELEGDGDDETVVEVWAGSLAGATVQIAGQTAVLDEGGSVRVAVRPSLRGTSVALRFERAGATLSLATDWSDDFALTQTPAGTRTDALVLRVVRAPDGRCALTRPMLDAGGVTRTETLPRGWDDRECVGWSVPPAAR